jgi:hypothetical protein
MALPKRPFPTSRERDKLHDSAVRNLVKAAAALDTYETSGLALAIYSTGIALMRMVELDNTAAAGEMVLKLLDQRAKA